MIYRIHISTCIFIPSRSLFTDSTGILSDTIQYEYSHIIAPHIHCRTCTRVWATHIRRTWRPCRVTSRPAGRLHLTAAIMRKSHSTQSRNHSTKTPVFPRGSTQFDGSAESSSSAESSCSADSKQQHTHGCSTDGRATACLTLRLYLGWLELPLLRPR